MNTNGYAGKIKQSGTQSVKAPCQHKPSSKGTVSYSGGDLRTGTKGKSGK